MTPAPPIRSLLPLRDRVVPSAPRGAEGSAAVRGADCAALLPVASGHGAGPHCCLWSRAFRPCVSRKRHVNRLLSQRGDAALTKKQRCASPLVTPTYLRAQAAGEPQSTLLWFVSVRNEHKSSLSPTSPGMG